MSSFGTLQSNESPGPEILIHLLNPIDTHDGQDRGVSIGAVIDTGADTSAVPEDVVHSLIANSPNEVENEYIFMENADGTVVKLRSFRLSVSLAETQGDLTLSSVPAMELNMISIPRATYAIIGRDYLSKFKISIDFNSQKWRFCNAANCSLS